MRVLAIILGAAALAACATPYQEKSIWNSGGVSAKQVTADTFIISSRGNPYTKAGTVQAHALRKAADVTVAAGFDWFMAVDSRDQSKVGFIASSSNGIGYAMPLTRHGESITVKMGKNPRPDAALDAREVIAFAEKRG